MALSAYILLTLLSLGFVNSENTTLVDDTCQLEPWEPGPWSALLEEWAVSAPIHSDRQGRIMVLPTKGYYVTERIDVPLTPPPPPPPGRPLPPGASPHGPPSPSTPPHSESAMTPGPTKPSSLQSPGPAMVPAPAPSGSLRTPLAPHNYNEWEPPGSKIVNRPHSQFKPSYPPPMPGYGPRPPRPAADRVDDPPRKQVSETDLYLLGAIEKLVYRVDLMEKRLRRLEDSLHYVVAGADSKPEACAANFTRAGGAGGACVQWARDALDWQAAARACRRLHAALLELPEPAQRRRLVSHILADNQLRGNDFWTGGLNPGLLWIWSHSGRPVESNKNATNSSSSIAGEGRCLALVHDAAINSYVYRGRDCALKLPYVCQKEDDKEKISNEIERAARKLKSIEKRRAKILWDEVV
ncbi:unnamed protein product [Parnassius mnemosyne]|uniref:C-type lectin domain-containing protein n=1 Tax=Parnassius mnemosyne TaxID=213953 RepID=A0AAV1M1T7_9NEOP